MSSPANPPDPNAAAPNAATPTATEPTFAHVPMTEKLELPRHTLPDALPITIGMLLVVAVVGIMAWVLRAKPVVTGTIDDAYAVTVPNADRSLVIVTINMQNVNDETLQLMNVNISAHANGTDAAADFGSVSDYPRYFQAFPALQQHARPGLSRETMLAAKQKLAGSVLVALPLTQEEFDARDSLTATLTFDNYAPVKIVSRKKP